MPNNPDPTKDAAFQHVVRHFVTTPPKPHKEASPKIKEKPTDDKSKAKAASRATSKSV
jgi:hypothetical protein